MSGKVVYCATVAFSLAALALLAVNITVLKGNQELQLQAAQRQQAIVASQNLSPLNQNLAQALADASVKYDDADLKALLASQGITINKEAAAKTKEVEKKAADKDKKENNNHKED